MNIYLLPDDVKNYIFNFISNETLYLTNKYYWINNYPKKINAISNIKSYSRFLIRNNLSFIFDKFLSNSINHLIKSKKIYYKGNRYNRHIDLLYYQSKFEYKSVNCINLITKLMKDRKLQFKKIKTVNNIWNN